MSNCILPFVAPPYPSAPANVLPLSEYNKASTLSPPLITVLPPFNWFIGVSNRKGSSKLTNTVSPVWKEFCVIYKDELSGGIVLPSWSTKNCTWAIVLLFNSGDVPLIKSKYAKNVFSLLTVGSLPNVFIEEKVTPLGNVVGAQTLILGEDDLDPLYLGLIWANVL